MYPRFVSETHTHTPARKLQESKLFAIHSSTPVGTGAKQPARHAHPLIIIGCGYFERVLFHQVRYIITFFFPLPGNSGGQEEDSEGRCLGIEGERGGVARLAAGWLAPSPFATGVVLVCLSIHTIPVRPAGDTLYLDGCYGDGWNSTTYSTQL